MFAILRDVAKCMEKPLISKLIYGGILEKGRSCVTGYSVGKVLLAQTSYKGTLELTPEKRDLHARSVENVS